MALVLDATVGGSAANVYLTLADAETYFSARPFTSVWTAAADADKNVALVYATTLLDQQKWKGAKGSTPAGALTQALAWPREWAPTLEADANPEFVTEYFIDLSVGYYSSLTIPQPIRDATCELALEILRAGTTDPLTKDTTWNIAAESVGPIRTQYVDPGVRVFGIGQFQSVMRLIQPLLRNGTQAIARV